MNEAAWTCNPEDDLAEAEAIMGKANVRRLPVSDGSERGTDLLFLTDLAQRTDSGPQSPPTTMHQVSETSTATGAPGARRSRPPLPDGLSSPSLTPLEGAQRRSGGGRLLDAAGRKHRLRRGTVALRWCSDCGRFLGFKLWPRTGRALVHTHGLCRPCFGRMMRRMMRDALTGPALLETEQVGSAGDESLL